jgi:cephalosporin hydroxylase
MTVFWDVAPCCLVEIGRRFGGASSFINTLMTEAANTFETPANFYHITQRYNPEDSHFHTRRRENLKSYLIGDKCSQCVRNDGISSRGRERSTR